jgi:hypothetical protein
MHYATNRKVAGSIPDEVIFLNLPNTSGRTRPWGFIQPLTEMSTRSIKIIMFLESKVRRVCGRLSRQCGILNISQPYRSPRPIMGRALLFFKIIYNKIYA